VRQCYPVVRGEGVVGLLEAIRLDLGATQLAVFATATVEIAREVLAAHRRRRMPSARMKKMVQALLGRSSSARG
jgi:hypothetical protein